MRKRLRKKIIKNRFISARCRCCGSKFKKIHCEDPYLVGYHIHKPNCIESLNYRENFNKATDLGFTLNSSEVVGN